MKALFDDDNNLLCQDCYESDILDGYEVSSGDLSDEVMYQCFACDQIVTDDSFCIG